MARLKKQAHGKTSYSVNSNSNSKGSSSRKTVKKLINKKAKGDNEVATTLQTRSPPTPPPTLK